MIKITFPDNSVKEYAEGTTAMQIAESISSRLAQEVLAASVNGEIWDLTRPINQDAAIKLFKWEDEEGKHAFWHTSAHLLAEALQELYPGIQFGIGPAIENGFYYDVDLGDEELFKDFSPAFRQSDITDGLNTYLRMIEFAVGLAYGDLSNPETVAKTATEIKSAKDRKYNTVSAIQKQLRYCLDDLVYALAFYNSLTTSGYSFVCDFKDSILTDEETERKQDIQDLNLGIMKPERISGKVVMERTKRQRKRIFRSHLRLSNNVHSD